MLSQHRANVSRYLTSRVTAYFGVIAALAILATGPALAETARPTEVFVLATLYKRHETVAAYDLAKLRKIIQAVDPAALVVDCTPREIREQKVWPSKIEYPQVVFPFARERKLPVYAGEPDEPLFTEIVQSVSQANAVFEKTHPEHSGALEKLTADTYAALSIYWTDAARVNDDITSLALDGAQTLSRTVIGPAMVTGNRRWNSHWADQIITAARKHPGQRILALVGVENRREITEHLRSERSLAVVDVAEWLRSAK